jgi:late competence protein required for DNA uptake (superfamily II DNA/RNA helicase)
MMKDVFIAGINYPKGKIKMDSERLKCDKCGSENLAHLWTIECSEFGDNGDRSKYVEECVCRNCKQGVYFPRRKNKRRNVK